MESKEFRLGNYYIDIEGNLSELSGYELYQMTVKENNGNLGVLEYQPIKLTKEWLVKFGFERNHVPFSSYWSHDEIEYNVREVGGKFAFCIENFEDGHTINYIMHTDEVHVFQNNAFALTGKELKQ